MGVALPHYPLIAILLIALGLSITALGCAIWIIGSATEGVRSAYPDDREADAYGDWPHLT